MLTTFKQFLHNKERIPERNISYYLKWVADCYRFFNAPETHHVASKNILGVRSPLDR